MPLVGVYKLMDILGLDSNSPAKGKPLVTIDHAANWLLETLKQQKAIVDWLNIPYPDNITPIGRNLTSYMLSIHTKYWTFQAFNKETSFIHLYIMVSSTTSFGNKLSILLLCRHRKSNENYVPCFAIWHNFPKKIWTRVNYISCTDLVQQKWYRNSQLHRKLCKKVSTQFGYSKLAHKDLEQEKNRSLYWTHLSFCTRKIRS